MAGYGREAFFMDCRQRKMTCQPHAGLLSSTKARFGWLATSGEKVATEVRNVRKLELGFWCLFSVWRLSV